MKEYNRKTKKWEVPTTENVGDLKKRELCRGGKPHQMILTMPPYGFKNLDLSQEVIQKYYESRQRLLEFENNEVELLLALGIPVRRGWSSEVHRYTKCEICGKKDL